VGVVSASPRAPITEQALFDANEYLIAGLENQAEWWEHLGDAHRDYAALARVAVAQQAEVERLRDAIMGPIREALVEIGREVNREHSERVNLNEVIVQVGNGIAAALAVVSPEEPQ
jgi:hypothetical protein